MLRAACVVALSLAAAAAQPLSPIQAIKQEVARLAQSLPGNVCPFGSANSIVSPSRRLSGLTTTLPSGASATQALIHEIQSRNPVLRCFLPGLTMEARVMHDTIGAGNIDQARHQTCPRLSEPAFDPRVAPVANLSASSTLQLRGRWGLPEEVMSQLRFIVLSESVAFKSFSLVFSIAGGVTLAEYVGAARRSSGVAEVAIAHVQATAKAMWATLKPARVDCRTRSISDCPINAFFQGVPETLPDGRCRILETNSMWEDLYPSLGYPYLFSNSFKLSKQTSYRCREGSALVDYNLEYSKPGPILTGEVAEVERALRAAAFSKLSDVVRKLQ